MSFYAKHWDDLAERLELDHSYTRESLEYYIGEFGPNVIKGLDIGHEVVRKAKNGCFDELWPTLIASNGQDNGITAGFLVAACRIHPINSGDNSIDGNIFGYNFEQVSEGFLATVKNKVNAQIKTISDLSELPDELQDVPSSQGWQLPGLLIEYYQPKPK